MLELEEFIELFLAADDETRAFVEQVLTQDQPSSDCPE